MNEVESWSRFSSPVGIYDSVLSLPDKYGSIWHRQKPARFCSHILKFKNLVHKTVYGGDNDFGQGPYHDSVVFHFLVLNQLDSLILYSPQLEDLDSQQLIA